MINAKKKTLLLVVDVQADLQILQHTLESLSYEILAVTSGEQAGEVSLKALPDRILLDAVIPNGMDGFEILRRLKNSPSTEKIPVVLVKAKNGHDDISRFYDEGASHHIEKPFCQKEVVSCVKTHLILPSCQSFNNSSVINSSEASLGNGATKVLPKPNNELTVQIPDKSLAEMTKEYLGAIQKEVLDMQKAMNQRDYVLIKRYAHNFAGSGASYGLKIITDLSRALEFTASQNQESATAVLIDSIQSYVEQVQINYAPQ